MESMAAIHLAPEIERVWQRLGAVSLPSIPLSWIRLEMVFLTGAMIMAG